MPFVSGIVYDSTGTPAASRVVRVYRRDTGLLLTSTLSSAGPSPAVGSYSANIGTYLDEVQVVVLHNDVGELSFDGISRATGRLPQICQITVGGTFTVGTVLRASLGTDVVNYTTQLSDATLNGVAASFASAIDALANYSATATGPTITVTGPVSADYAASVSTPLPPGTAMNSLTTQTAQVVGPGTGYYAILTISNTAGDVEPIPNGQSFGYSVFDDAVPVWAYNVTTNAGAGVITLANVISGLTLNPAISGYSVDPRPGFPAQFTISGPAGELGVNVSTFFQAPYTLTVSVQNPGTPPITSPRAQIVEITLVNPPQMGSIYRVVLASIHVFEHTATGTDTPATIATALAAAIHADPNYTATTAGNVIIVTGNDGVDFPHVVSIVPSLLTLTGVITQEEV